MNKGVIYGIKVGDQWYVGSTSDFKRRKLSHLNTCNNSNMRNYNYLVYQHMRGYGVEKCEFIILEEYPCETKGQLHKREGEWIRKIGSLNQKIAGRNYKQWYIDNKTKLSSYHKNYHIQNKEKIINYQHIYNLNNAEIIKVRKHEYHENNKERLSIKKKERRLNNLEKIHTYYNTKIQCDCGAIVSRSNYACHRRTNQHKSWVDYTNSIDGLNLINEI